MVPEDPVVGDVEDEMCHNRSKTHYDYNVLRVGFNEDEFDKGSIRGGEGRVVFIHARFVSLMSFGSISDLERLCCPIGPKVACYLSPSALSFRNCQLNVS